ncbi:MAG: C4-dicarboxylate ABC transporter permease [Desulfobacteraceae bacterium]|nr:MAG: C4-dicarboxylate ABC transporter permease [Desulfobacteraceae bacterium]
MIEGLIGGFGSVIEPFNLFLLFIGTGLGILVGALPGLSSPMAIIVLLPLTYSMDTLAALLMIIGVYVGSKLGGSFPAILLRTPGTPAGACTALDGYPMAQRGQAGLALGYATMGSTFGGIFGWFLAVTCVPLLSSIAVKSSNADIALIGILGLVMVSAFVRGSTLRGLIGVVLGLLIATVGLDPIQTTPRFTFGSYNLMSGVPFAAALVGFFGIAVVMSDIKMIGRSTRLAASDFSQSLPKWKDLAARWQCIVIGALYGTGIGAIPGIGAEVSPWISYATVKNKSKTPEAFGTGIAEGVLTPEATNNANCGGTMIPMLSLGIPGDGSTAIMLGAMILHGLEPGVMLMKNSSDIVYGILAGLLVSTLFMFLISWQAIKYFVLILRYDRSWLFPFILVFATLGAYLTMNTTFPVFIAIIFGIVGYIFESRKFPVVTVVLGIILGPIVEQNFRLALALSKNDWATFVATWPRVVMIAAILFLLAWEIHKEISAKPGRAIASPTSPQKGESK